MCTEKPILAKFGVELKFSAPIIAFVGNLQLSVGKLQLPAPPTFLTHPRRR